MRRITQLSSVWEASNYADRGIGDISKPPRVVNGQSVGPAAVCGGRQRTRTEELGTSRSHFELLAVSLWGRQRYVGAGSGRRLRNWGHLEATSSC